MNQCDRYDHYIEELFQAQFEIFEKILAHHPSRGQSREDFIKTEILRRFQNINIQQGFVAGIEESISRQTDILILKNNAQTRIIGQNDLPRN